jgi:hypothetical protein
VAPYPAEQHAALQQAVREYAPATLPKGAGRRIVPPGIAPPGIALPGTALPGIAPPG